jgi:hypothetical protein
MSRAQLGFEAMAEPDVDQLSLFSNSSTGSGSA